VGLCSRTAVLAVDVRPVVRAVMAARPAAARAEAAAAA